MMLQPKLYVFDLREATSNTLEQNVFKTYMPNKRKLHKI